MKMKLQVKFNSAESDALNFVARALGITNEEFVRLSTIKSINLATQAVAAQENTRNDNDSKSANVAGDVAERQSGSDSAVLSDSGN